MWGEYKINIQGIKIKQFGVNSNIATTGHKLQALTKKNQATVSSWTRSIRNWVFIALSRVKELKGLFILKRSDPEKGYSIKPILIREEEKLSKIEKVIAIHKPICTFKNDYFVYF